MASTIKIKRSSVPSKIPTTSDIATGELAINTKDRKIYSSNGTAVFSFTSDYLQVANAVATYTTKASPTTSGVLAHTGRATISTNLTVSGNTVIGKLVANGSLGTSGYALKSNGSTVYWDAVGTTGGGSGGTVVSLTTATVKDLTQNDTVVTAVSVGTASSYLQVANAVAIYQTKAVERAALANTNLAITNVKTGLTSTNTAIRNLVSDRLQVANAASIYQTKSVERAALANTNLAITNVKTGLTTTNTALRLLISDRLQVANAVAIYQTKAIERSALANTNLRINLINTNLTGTNTAIRTLVSDRLQVANAVSTYATKSNPTTSGVLAHTGRATISTNLTVSGNTVIGKLVANGSLGTSGYALKSNGSTVYWDAVGSGAGGGSTTQYLQVANAVAIYQTKSVERAALANTNLAITNVKTGLTTTNTAVRLLVSDRLQVANAVILYASKYDSQYLLTGTTTNATETELLIGGVSRVSVTSGKTAYYTIDIVARRTDTTGDHAAFRLQGVVNNNAGTVTDIGSIFETIIYRSNANYLVDARADNTNDSIDIYVTGVVGHTINWRAIITIMQV